MLFIMKSSNLDIEERNKALEEKMLSEALEMHERVNEIFKKYDKDLDAINNSKPRWTRSSNTWN